MERRNFDKIYDTLQSLELRAIFKLIFKGGKEGQTLQACQELLGRAGVKPTETSIFIKQLISQKHVIRQQNKLICSFMAQEVSSNPWVIDGQTNENYALSLQNLALKIIKNSQGNASLEYIQASIKQSASTRSELTFNQVQIIINSLIYDEKVTEIQAIGYKFYVANTYSGSSGMYGGGIGTVPCCQCQFFDVCGDGDLARDCVYIKQWLSEL